MSAVFIYGETGDEVEVTFADTTHQWTVRLGEDTWIYLPPRLAERLNAVLGEALAAAPDESREEP